MAVVMVDCSFDDIRSRDIRFLEAASRYGQVRVALHSDNLVRNQTGELPKFPFEERRYLLESIRFVDRVILRDAAWTPFPQPNESEQTPFFLAVPAWRNEARHTEFVKMAKEMDAKLVLVSETDLPPLPHPPSARPVSTRHPKVLVTGCYDWFHSGHVRFFEEAAALGELYVVVGNDANVRLLKGPPHPMFCQNERRYVVASVRTVALALISSGSGWLDAEPEIEAIQPDRYVVNEDGDRPEKKEYCARKGIEYVVLRRLPRHGLPRRQSTHLRGF